MSFFIQLTNMIEYPKLIKDARISHESDQQTMLRAMYDSSYVWQGKVREDFVGLIGVVPSSLIGDSAYIWFFAGDKFKEHSFIAIRYSRKIIEEILKVYPILYGHCIINESNSRRWIRFLGAKFGDPHGELIPFEIRTKA